MAPNDVFRSIERAGAELVDPVVTIGNFDGVHIGHREIFRHTRERAEDAGVRAAAITFTPHPVRYFRPDAAPFRLTTDPQKFRLIRESGIDAVVAIPFDDRLANLAPEDFVDEIIDTGIGARRVVVGRNFAFGKDREGSTEDLRRLAAERGIEADILDEIEREGDVVSSTRIRNALADGEIALVSRLLDRNYRLLGRVESGEGRGRELGYPTANVAAENLVPADGVYATYLHRRSEHLPAATSIGTRPTFDAGARTVEAHVLDRDDLDLYGDEVELEFVAYLRDEASFDSADELVRQMDRDVAQVREILGLDETNSQ